MLVALSVEQDSGTAACMTFAQLKKGVERRLRRRVFVEAADAQLRLDVRFVKTGADTEARITLASIDGAPRGSRSLSTDKHCSALDDSLALSIALLVDQPPDPEPEPQSKAAPEAAPPSTSPTPLPQPATPPSPAKQRATTRITIPPEVVAPREPWHVRFGVRVGGAWGILPSVAPFGGVVLTLVPRHVAPIELDGEAFMPVDAERDRSSGAHFRLFRGGLSLCPTLIEQPSRTLSWCVGQKLGWFAVEGYGFDRDRQERRLSFALTAGLQGRMRLISPIWGRAVLGAEVPLARDRFVSGGEAPVKLFEAAPVAISGHIGVEAELW